VIEIIQRKIIEKKMKIIEKKMKIIFLNKNEILTEMKKMTLLETKIKRVIKILI
jgi:hypothetical protein